MRIHRYISINLILLSLLLSAICLNNTDHADKYFTEVKKNMEHFEKKIEFKEFQYNIRYTPALLKMHLYNKRHPMTKDEKAQFLAEHEASVDFVLSLAIPSQGQKEFLKYDGVPSFSYEDRLKYFSFEFKKDIKLVLDQKDTIPCTDFHFERGYNVSPDGKMTLAFTTPQKFKEMKLLFNDRCFARQELSVTFTKQDIKEIKKLRKYK